MGLVCVQIIQAHGGAVDPTFSSRCTHLLCESQVSGLFAQVRARLCWDQGALSGAGTVVPGEDFLPSLKTGHCCSLISICLWRVDTSVAPGFSAREDQGGKAVFPVRGRWTPSAPAGPPAGSSPSCG